MLQALLTPWEKLEAYQQLWYQTSIRKDNATDVVNALNGTITVAGLLVAACFAAVLAQLPNPEGYDSVNLVYTYRVSSALAFMLLLLVIMTAYGLQSFLLFNCDGTNLRRLKASAADNIVRQPLMRVTLMLCVSLVAMAVSMTAAMFYMCKNEAAVPVAAFTMFILFFGLQFVYSMHYNTFTRPAANALLEPVRMNEVIYSQLPATVADELRKQAGTYVSKLVETQATTLATTHMANMRQNWAEEQVNTHFAGLDC